MSRTHRYLIRLAAISLCVWIGAGLAATVQVWAAQTHEEDAPAMCPMRHAPGETCPMHHSHERSQPPDDGGSVLRCGCGHEEGVIGTPQAGKARTPAEVVTVVELAASAAVTAGDAALLARIFPPASPPPRA